MPDSFKTITVVKDRLGSLSVAVMQSAASNAFSWKTSIRAHKALASTCCCQSTSLLTFVALWSNKTVKDRYHPSRLYSFGESCNTTDVLLLRVFSRSQTYRMWSAVYSIKTLRARTENPLPLQAELSWRRLGVESFFGSRKWSGSCAALIRRNST